MRLMPIWNPPDVHLELLRTVRDVDPKIVGGIPANPHEFPYQVHLGLNEHFICGGTILSTLFILTAAHCMNNVKPSSIKRLRVVAGDHNLLDSNGFEQERFVSNVYQHENYNNETLENDIALLMLSKPLEFNENVSSISYPRSKTEFEGTATASGWGQTIEGVMRPISFTLRKVYIPIVPKSECQKKYEKTKVKVTDQILCAGSENNDSCQGDSGGPVTCTDKLTGKPLLCGVISFGIGCGQARYPGVNTDVSHYWQWIGQIMKKGCKPPDVVYKSHLEVHGWEHHWSKNGEMSGTTGQSRRLEAIQIQLQGETNGMGIEYSAHLEGPGWQSWVKNGEVAGTTGQSRRLEAIMIKLTNNPLGFDIWYRAHLQDIGWQGWVKNGEVAGTTGQWRRLEAIEIRIGSRCTPDVSYKSHLEGTGWEAHWFKNGEMSGTTGQSRRLEAIQIQLEGQVNGMGVEYSAHLEGPGWQGWVRNGEVAGTTGQSRRLEAIKIKLTNYPSGFDILYRAHLQDIGWQDWVKNGEVAGTTGQWRRLEAIEIMIRNSDPNPK